MLFCSLVKSQTLIVEYNAFVKDNFTNKYHVFPAILESNSQQKVKLYKVNFGIKEDLKEKSTFVVTSKKKFQYKLFSQKSNKLFIEDLIQDKPYLLEDNLPEFKWQLLNEKKVVKNVILYKATTNFRGRDYIIWYDKNIKTYYGPWKFNNVPGLVYEVFEKTGFFKWEMVSYVNSTTDIADPFLTKEKFLDYKNYPKLRYGLSPELVEALKKNPNNNIFEQEKNGLEIKFEWEE